MGLSSGATIFGIIVLISTLRDLISVTEPSNDSGTGSMDTPHTDIDTDTEFLNWKPQEGGPGSKISSAKFIGPTIKILYCTACGYKNAYDQYAEFIHEKYPEIGVEGISYPPPFIRRVASQVMMVLKFALIGMMLTNQWNLLRFFGLPARAIAWIAENKIYAALLLFFLVNIIESQVASTGAFEVYIDDMPVWSKLQTGRLPNPPELVQMIDNHLKLGGSHSSTFQFDT